MINKFRSANYSKRKKADKNFQNKEIQYKTSYPAALVLAKGLNRKNKNYELFYCCFLPSLHLLGRRSFRKCKGKGTLSHL